MNTFTLRILLLLSLLAFFITGCGSSSGSSNEFVFDGQWTVDYFAEIDDCDLGAGLSESHSIETGGDDPLLESESGLIVARDLSLRDDGSLLAVDNLIGGIRLADGSRCDLLSQVSYAPSVLGGPDQADTLFRFQIQCPTFLFCESAYIGLAQRVVN